MSKEKNRGGREAKKPKQQKAKAVASSKHPPKSAVATAFGKAPGTTPKK